MKISTFGSRALHFYKNIEPPENLPGGVEVMNPYLVPEVRSYAERFLARFFSDNKSRVYVFGINPGRFGAGLTGVTFTDPIALETFCGINNDLEKRREISSEFIYEFIKHWGGIEKFYQDFFLTAVSPLGFICKGKNFNYYDDRNIFARLKPFIVKTLHAQLARGARRDVAILLGAGKNKDIFDELNMEYSFFKKIYALEHPRFIMQYRRRRVTEYLKKYKEVFLQALSA